MKQRVRVLQAHKWRLLCCLIFTLLLFHLGKLWVLLAGGELKTVAKADSESLQASWVEDVQTLSLRCKDILPVIERARLYHSTATSQPWHPAVLPALRAHPKLLLRIVTIIRKKAKSVYLSPF